MLFQFDAGEGGEGLAGDVVVGGAEATGDDDQRCPAGGETQGGLEVGAFVVDAERADAFEAQGAEGAGEEVRVAVGVGAGQ